MRGRRACWTAWAKWAQERRWGPPVAFRRVRAYVAARVRGAKGVAGALATISHLIVGLRRLAADHDTIVALQDARDALQRLRHLFPTKQARPATARQVRSLWVGAQGRAEQHGLVAALLWAAAARFSDVARLFASDVQVGTEWTRIRYRITKTSQRGAVRVVEVRLAPEVAAALRQWRRRRAEEGPSAQLFTLGLRGFNAWLARVTPGLTSRSLRRGAVQAALDAGVDERDVVRLTGHTRVATLLTYADRVGRRARAALQRCAEALTW